MADQTDKTVDEHIADLQAALDALKASQRKDDAADEPRDRQPKSLRDANRKARDTIRQSLRRKADYQNKNLENQSNSGEKSGNAEDE